MRILALGIPLPDGQIDNYDWGTAPSFFDYDAIIADPLAISRVIESVAREGASQLTYADEPVEDGRTTANNVGLADLLRQRRDETERLLAKNGLVVCFGYPDVPHPRVSGFTGAHRYYWLPAPEGRDYGPAQLKPAAGERVTVTDYEHPFGAYLERVDKSVLYRATFAEGAEGLGGKIIGRSPGGAAIATEIEVGGGRIIFLPALSPRITSTERSAVASGIVTAIRNALLLGVEGDEPEWLQDIPIEGIEEAQERLDAAEARLEQAEIELDEARNAYRAIDRYRRLLWQEGKYGFELPVRDALTLLGMSSFSRSDEPALFYFDGETILVETESSDEAVGMEPHYRLRQRIEQKIATEGKRPPALIVVNGYRDKRPAERTQQYSDSLRVAAESMRYCVVEATTLFEAVGEKLAGGSDAAAFCRGLLETEGIYTPAPSAISEPTTAEE